MQKGFEVPFSLLRGHATVLLGDLARQFDVTGDDINHLLDLQHWNLVRKVQHGMLDGGETEQSPSVDDLPAAADPQKSGVTDDPSEFEGMAPAEVKEALADPGIPAHGKWAGLSEEEVKALLEALVE